ncbi:IS630 family transposase, partial [Francisella tularensis subsp. holarctica]|nr:IS630 family transposase [Francisella tularensis subsp. holarctica]
MPTNSQDFRDIVNNQYEEVLTDFELSKFFHI